MTVATELDKPVHELKMIVRFRVRNSCELFLILSIQIRPELEQQHCNLLVALLRGTHQGRLPLVIPQVHVRAPLDQPAQGIHVVVAGGHVQGGLPLRVGAVDGNSVEVQKLHQLVAPPLDRNVEWGLPIFGELGQLGSTAIAELGQPDVPGVARVLQEGLPALHIGGFDIRSLQKPLQDVHQNAAVLHDDLLQVEGHVLGRLAQRLELIPELLSGTAHVVGAAVELRHGRRRRLTPPDIHVLHGRRRRRNHLLASAPQSSRHSHPRIWSWLLLLLRLRPGVMIPPHVRIHDR
mmetsp:Transcript_21615/g.52712  ORF Transcript_21615/g.52712 Transcript_21615/m.52712 type:complete len:292 (-) Transcript_21615:1086-1961(-)